MVQKKKVPRRKLIKKFTDDGKDIKFKGVVKASIEADFTEGDVGGSGQVHFVYNTNRNIELVGYGCDKSIIIGELANNLGSSFAYNRFNVVNWSSNSDIKDLTVIGKNVRYPIHIDGGQLGVKLLQNFRQIKSLASGERGRCFELDILASSRYWDERWSDNQYN